MKFSEKTINILKNFATINNSILVKKGNRLRTISPMKNILAEVDIEEEMPKDFAIYDLGQFLNTIYLLDTPEFDFSNDNYVLIKENKSKFKYFYADSNLIICPPEKELVLPSKDVCFQLEKEQLNQLLKAADVLGLQDLSAVGENGSVNLIVRDKNNSTSNDYCITVGTTDKVFTCNFKRENIKIIPGSYDVVISSKQLSCFTNKQYNLDYYIALEPDSTFG